VFPFLNTLFPWAFADRESASLCWIPFFWLSHWEQDHSLFISLPPDGWSPFLWPKRRPVPLPGFHPTYTFSPNFFGFSTLFVPADFFALFFFSNFYTPPQRSYFTPVCFYGFLIPRLVTRPDLLRKSGPLRAQTFNPGFDQLSSLTTLSASTEIHKNSRVCRIFLSFSLLSYVLNLAPSVPPPPRVCFTARHSVAVG